MISAELEPLNLKAGELVAVKTEAEILAILDREGKLQSLPFMPEMLKYCGQRFRVHKRATKTCDTIQGTWRRRMEDAVHLDLRCDGGAHDGCQAKCLLFWKEAWLRRVDESDGVRVQWPRDPQAGARTVPTTGAGARFTRNDLTAACRSVNSAGEAVYMCQTTELRAATSPLKWWQAGQYIRDVRSGNITVGHVIWGTLIGLFNKMQMLLSRYVPARFLIHGGLKYPFIEGSLTKTPKATLNLVAGDVVEIKSKEEIAATLDTNNRNRGLSFDREMVGYCGRRARVLSRVTKMIDERTRKMIAINNDCLILEGVYCRGEFNQFCTRASYLYWREIWLKKVGHVLTGEGADVLTRSEQQCSGVVECCK
jgi:hypothetical protein